MHHLIVYGKNKWGNTMERVISRILMVTLILILPIGVVLTTPPIVLAQTLSLSPSSGPPNAVITTTGSSFLPSTPGWVWYDSNRDSVRDPGEPQVSVTTTAAGALPAGVVLTVPGVVPGIYPVRADIPVGGAVDASANFTVSTPSLSLSPTNGIAGTILLITGSSFTLNSAGLIWFDSNGNNVLDAGEPQVAVTTTAAGAIPAGTILTVPIVASATYQVRADIPTGGSVEATASFTVLPIPSMTLSPTSGAPGTMITITGTNFALNTAGVVGFDSNGNNAIDLGEPQVPLTTTAAGAIPAGIILTVPSEAPGIYRLLADIPTGGSIEASATFTVPISSISLSPASGVPGTVITITGSGFALNTAGVIGFDSNGNNAIDPGEPQVPLTTTAVGALPAGIILTVPSAVPGIYRLLADIPTGGSIEASANFTVAISSITLTPSSGAPATVISITGTNFAPNTAGKVGFDSNGNNAIDLGEPQVPVTTTAAGALPDGVILTIPGVSPGTFRVLADIPTGGSIEATASFTVSISSISLSPTSGVPGTVITVTGSGFALNTAGVVGFDSNGNNVLDAGEPQVPLTTTAAGALPAGIILTVPSAAPGIYQLLADIPASGGVEASASFTVPTVSMSLSSTSGAPGTVITVSGSGFMPNTAGWVWFDSNGDSVRNAGEPQVPATTTAAGAIPSGGALTIPAIAAGGYQVLADIPSGGTSEASASFTVVVRAIALSPASGASGTIITITGSGFTLNTAGWVWFDSNGDSVRNAGEPQVPVTTTAAGAIPSGVALSVPVTAAGGYQVLADIPSGGTSEASASFTLVVRAIALSPASGVPGTVITITGSGFTSDTLGWVWFDSNSNGARDAGEPQVSMTTTTAGFIPAGVTLIVPAAAPQVYKVLGDIPTGGTVEASASFAVTPPPSPGLLLGSVRGEIILAPGIIVEVLAPGALPFMGTMGIQSTGLRYDVDIWTTTAWSTVVEAGVRNASYSVSGFGLRINNDTTESMTVTYVIVYLRQ